MSRNPLKRLLGDGTLNCDPLHEARHKSDGEEEEKMPILGIIRQFRGCVKMDH